MRPFFVSLLLAFPSALIAQAPSVDWPIYGGTSDNTRYSTLSQITPANVKQLAVAWTYETHDDFKGSEMQSNPIVIDGVLYATTPRLRVIALDAATGRERWSFHTIPHPGEFGYATWSPDAWKVSGGTNVWAGLTVDHKLGMVFGGTGSASFDFYGANRLGDNLFANTILALDARTGKRIWHFQGVRHDLWDMDFPSPPALVTVIRHGKPIDALAQTTKTGHVWLLDRKTGAPLFPVAEHRVPPSLIDGERASPTQRLPVKPPALVRQTLTEDQLTTRTPRAHDSALTIFRKFTTRGLFAPPSTTGSIVFPGYDGGAEWGGPAFDPESGLLYVNVNEMAWLLKMEPRSDKSSYQNNCASCHRSDLQGTPPTFPSLVDIGKRKTRDELVAIVRQRQGQMPAFREVLDGTAINGLVAFLVTGPDVAETAAANPNFLKYRNNGYIIFNDPDGYPAIKPPWGTLNAVDLNKGVIRWRIPFGEYPALAAQGLRNTGTDNYGGTRGRKQAPPLTGRRREDKNKRTKHYGPRQGWWPPPPRTTGKRKAARS